MSVREVLPARRHGESFDVEFEGHKFRVQVNEYDGGRLGEVFVNAHLVNRPLDAFAGDSAILLSLLLQHGVAPAEIAHALRRHSNGTRASVIGLVADQLVALDRDRDQDPPGMIKRGKQRFRRQAWRQVVAP